MHNIGDLVYIYLFDLEKTLMNMNQLRDDRFGKIKARKLQDKIEDKATKNIVYTVSRLDNSTLEYNESSLTYSMISIRNLIEIINRLDIEQNKKDDFMKQIQNVVNAFMN